MYWAIQLCVCSAGFELFELLLFDGLDVPELLPLFEGLEEGLELLELELFLFELEFVEAVLFFFDSEEFDLLEVSAFAAMSLS